MPYPTLPVVERIAASIEARLLTQFLKVVRPDQKGKLISPEDGKIILDQRDSIPNEELSHPGNPPAIAFDVAFDVYCYVRDALSDGDYAFSFATSCNIIYSRVAYALTNPATDPSSWYTFDGNAINSKLGDYSLIADSNGDSVGIKFPIEVTYRVSENDYTEARA